MRKLLQTIGAAAALLTLSMAANAAEVPPYPRPVAPPVYVPPPFSWTGFYIGANLGGAWGQRNLTDTLLGLSLSNVNEKGAFIGGGQLGSMSFLALKRTSMALRPPTVRAPELLAQPLERSK